MTVMPHGPDAIETWHTGCQFLPPLMVAPFAGGEVLPRTVKGTGNTQLGTNAFGDMTFSADGTARATEGCGSYKKRPGSQKRSFQKVETRDLAGKWCGCWFVGGILTFMGFWPFCCWTTKRALNQDQYEESGSCCVLGLPFPCPYKAKTHSRKYVHGHPTNGFDDGMRYRDPGCAGRDCFFAKKVG